MIQVSIPQTDGVTDFICKCYCFSTTRVTKFVLDDNASYDENSSELVIERMAYSKTTHPNSGW